MSSPSPTALPSRATTIATPSLRPCPVVPSPKATTPHDLPPCAAARVGTTTSSRVPLPTAITSRNKKSFSRQRSRVGAVPCLCGVTTHRSRTPDGRCGDKVTDEMTGHLPSPAQSFAPSRGVAEQTSSSTRYRHSAQGAGRASGSPLSLFRPSSTSCVAPPFQAVPFCIYGAHVSRSSPVSTFLSPKQSRSGQTEAKQGPSLPSLRRGADYRLILLL